MNFLKIEKEDFHGKVLLEIVKEFIFNYLKNEDTFIFDIHNTIEYDDKMDKYIVDFVKKNYKKCNIIFLSYDGNDERINFNNNILDSFSSIFTQTPKIFIKKRKKHYIIGYISKLLSSKFNFNKKIFFIDDNYLNILDAHKLTNVPNFNIIHYTAHTHRKSDESVEDLSSKF